MPRAIPAAPQLIRCRFTTPALFIPVIQISRKLGAQTRRKGRCAGLGDAASCVGRVRLIRSRVRFQF